MSDEDPRIYAVARKVTDEVLGKGTYKALNHPSLTAMADRGDAMLTEECPVCGGKGYEHRKGCYNVDYISGILTRIADGFDGGAMNDGEDVRAVRDNMGTILT